MSGPSQPKVTDEVWDDERVRSFLNLKPYDETDADYHALQNAYEYMRAEDFRRFVKFFQTAGRNLHVKNLNGETLLQRIEGHEAASDYRDILREASKSA